METNDTEYGLAGLFDFSFSKFATVTLVRVLYVIAIILSAIWVIIGVISAFTVSFWAGLFSIILAPLVFVIDVLIARILLEMIVVVFRIADHTREIAENTRS